MDKIKCGKCSCEYNPYWHNGCPQCGFGRIETYTTTDCRCQNCLGEPETFTLPVIDEHGREIIKEFKRK